MDLLAFNSYLANTWYDRVISAIVQLLEYPCEYPPQITSFYGVFFVVKWSTSYGLNLNSSAVWCSKDGRCSVAKYIVSYECLFSFACTAVYKNEKTKT